MKEQQFYIQIYAADVMHLIIDKSSCFLTHSSLHRLDKWRTRGRSRWLFIGPISLHLDPEQSWLAASGTIWMGCCRPCICAAPVRFVRWEAVVLSELVQSGVLSACAEDLQPVDGCLYLKVADNHRQMNR